MAYVIVLNFEYIREFSNIIICHVIRKHLCVYENICLSMVF